MHNICAKKLEVEIYHLCAVYNDVVLACGMCWCNNPYSPYTVHGSVVKML